jgi:catechol 2,3-dioxygenase-like lactoylglutathione lyase family enzyme
MAIIPTVRCSRMKASISFYTKVPDFEYVEGDDENVDRSFSVLTREGDSIFLTSHVLVDDVDALVRKFRDRGLTRNELHMHCRKGLSHVTTRRL